MIARPDSLVLVTIDCLRADHVSFLGYSQKTTPFLDSLAGESFVFANAAASGIPTYYSLPALHASRYPLAQGRDVIGVAPGESTLATELKECGFRTAAFVAANPYISAGSGYEQGFDVFRDFLNAGDAGRRTRVEVSGFRNGANRMLARACRGVPVLGAAYDEIYFRYCQKVSRSRGTTFDSLRRFPSAETIVDCAIAWLAEQHESRFFLWLHLMDPHAPYYPDSESLARTGGREMSPEQAKYLNSFWARADLGPERLRKKAEDIKALYDAGIFSADAQLGRLKSALCDLGCWDKCAMTVTADHGEEFLDHGGRFHAPTHLSEELVHVPLLLRVPGFSGRRDLVDPFGLIDLAPTLLDALDFASPASFRGQSRWREIANRQHWDSAVLTECAYGCTNPFERSKRLAPRLLSVRRGQHKLVLNLADGTERLFDLNSDPKEASPIPAGRASDMRKNLLERARRHVAESRTALNTDLRLAAQVRDFQSDCAFFARAS